MGGLSRDSHIVFVHETFTRENLHFLFFVYFKYIFIFIFISSMSSLIVLLFNILLMIYMYLKAGIIRAILI